MTPQAEDEFEPDDDDVDDTEAPDESDIDADGDEDVDTVPCPYCDHPVAEDAQICPHCRSFISFEDAPRHRPLWIWIAAMLALVAIGWWVILLLIRILTPP